MILIIRMLFDDNDGSNCVEVRYRALGEEKYVANSLRKTAANNKSPIDRLREGTLSIRAAFAPPRLAETEATMKRKTVALLVTYGFVYISECVHRNR